MVEQQSQFDVSLIVFIAVRERHRTINRGADERSDVPGSDRGDEQPQRHPDRERPDHRDDGPEQRRERDR